VTRRSVHVAVAVASAFGKSSGAFDAEFEAYRRGL
jgi:hypothetical protein